MAAYLGYTLRMKTLFHGWPVMVHDTHTKRRKCDILQLILQTIFPATCLSCHYNRLYTWSSQVKLQANNWCRHGLVVMQWSQSTYSTLCPVSAWMGDRLRAGEPPRYVTSHPGQHSLAIPPWIGALSTSLGWQGNRRFGVALAMRHRQIKWSDCKADEHPAYAPHLTTRPTRRHTLYASLIGSKTVTGSQCHEGEQNTLLTVNTFPLFSME